MIDFEVKLTVSNACVIPPCAAALSSETDTNTAESEYKVDTLKVNHLLLLLYWELLEVLLNQLVDRRIIVDPRIFDQYFCVALL